MSKCITEYIDDWCMDQFGHTNWEFYDSDNEDKYYEKYEDFNIAVFKNGILTSNCCDAKIIHHDICSKCKEHV